MDFWIGGVVLMVVVAYGMMMWFGKDKIKAKLWQLKKDNEIYSFTRNDSLLRQDEEWGNLNSN